MRLFPLWRLEKNRQSSDVTHFTFQFPELRTDKTMGEFPASTHPKLSLRGGVPGGGSYSARQVHSSGPSGSVLNLSADRRGE